MTDHCCSTPGGAIVRAWSLEMNQNSIKLMVGPVHLQSSQKCQVDYYQSLKLSRLLFRTEALLVEKASFEQERMHTNR
jgi:hypothetical protein